MAAKKKSHKRRVVRKRKSAPAKKRKGLARVRKSVRKVRKAITVASMKGKIRDKLNDQLRDALFRRDKAATYKQHRAAQFRIDTIRRELRKAS